MAMALRRRAAIADETLRVELERLARGGNAGLFHFGRAVL
jgi:hypothetical protein